MMLSNRVSIRRFISQRRSQDECEEVDMASTDRLELKAGRKDAAAAPKRRPYGRKRPPPPIIVSREQSIHDILDPLPPIPSYETPRSSDSSFNSYERHNDSNLSQSIDSKRSKSPLCSISSKSDRSQESLQPSSATSYGGDEFLPKLPPRGRARSSESLEHQAELSDLNPDSVEAFSVPSEDKATPPKQDLRRQKSSSSFSDNIQQLIKEADEAFKAVGSALAEVQFAESTFKELPRIPTPELSPLTQPAPAPTPAPARRASQFPVQLAQRSQTPQPESLSSPTGQTPRRSTSVSTGVKRKKSKKSKKVKTMSMKSYRKPTAGKSSAKSGPIWALSDNVTELFSGKFFHKIEVDEMLTPGQVEAYKLRRQSIMQQSEKVALERAALKEQASRELAAKESASKKSTETLNSEFSDTPVEPFHLDDLPSRIGSAGVAELEADTPKAEKPAVPPFDFVVQKDFSLEERSQKFNPRESRLDIGDEPVEYRDATFSTPPMRHAAQLARRSLKTALPSIPETSAISASKNDLFCGQNLSGSQDVVADSNYVFLQSAPCSMTSPIFRHGPIRLAKSDLIPDMKVGADEGLDWIAFQMAISGGAGDWFSESDDTLRRREAEEADELADWFGSWNFTRPGGLVTHEFEAPSPTSTTSGEDYSDVSYTDIEKDNPYSLHHQWQVPPRKAPVEVRRTNSRDMSGLQLDMSKMYPHELPDVPTKEFKEYNCRESYASLPQSPMLDLQVIRSPDGDDVDVVPMGYNLGHDLGDFLKWEAEHVYAGDF